MADRPPEEVPRQPFGVGLPEDGAIAGQLQNALQVFSREVRAPSSERNANTPFAFVIFAAIELAFVFGLLVCTKLNPAQVLQLAGGATAISVAGFFGRNAVVIIDRDRRYRSPHDYRTQNDS